MTMPSEYRLGPAEWVVTVPVGKSVSLNQSAVVPSPLSAKELVCNALESPFGFESMRRAMTSDDRVVIVVDDALPHLAELLAGVLEHVGSAGVKPDAVTLLLAPPAHNQGFIDDLPDEFADVKVEIHNPDDENRLAYLATTVAGRRVYLNRTLVEFEFAIVLTGRRFDPVSGFTGAANAIFPALSNAATRAEFQGLPPVENPFAERSERTEAEEITWLLGMPFLVQVIEGQGDSIHAVVAGMKESAIEGVRVQRERWIATTSGRAELVIASANGGEDALANALANAGRIVAAHGRIVLLADVPIRFGEAFGILRGSSDAATGARTILREKPEGTAAAVLWAFAARAAKLVLGPDWKPSLAEEFFATQIRSPRELGEAIALAKSVAVLPDAHKMYVTVST